MFSKVCGIGLLGVEGCMVYAEVDCREGLPSLTMTGNLAPEVRESQDRVRTALWNSGFRFSPRKITVNLSPADVHKSGTGFDLPIATAILAAHGQFDCGLLEQAVLIGELGLDGVVKPVRGILPMVMEAKRSGKQVCYLPCENVAEGQLVPDIEIAGIGHIKELVEVLEILKRQDDQRKEIGIVSQRRTDQDGQTSRAERAGQADQGRQEDQADQTGQVKQTAHTGQIDRWNQADQADRIGSGRKTNIKRHTVLKDVYDVDYQDVQGQMLMKRATEVAVAGRHNLLYIGPAGTGKTMIAERIPTIMPSCTMEEVLEISKIYSICGLLPKNQPYLNHRPFRSPHHSVTAPALSGGGKFPSPGEMSLASGGVLFLDELPEFSKHVIDMLRQPLESHKIVLSRVNGRYEFPADFMLVAAANPCPCGHYPDRNRCHCSDEQVKRYLGKISKPILDRIDICTEAAPVDFGDLQGGKKAECSADIRKRVERVRKIQKERFAGRTIRFNSQMHGDDLRVYCSLSRSDEAFFKEIYRRQGLSARAYARILKVARTIADLEGADRIGHEHLCEAIGYRSLEEKYWRTTASDDETWIDRDVHVAKDARVVEGTKMSRDMCMVEETGMPEDVRIVEGTEMSRDVRMVGETRMPEDVRIVGEIKMPRDVQAIQNAWRAEGRERG